MITDTKKSDFLKKIYSLFFEELPNEKMLARISEITKEYCKSKDASVILEVNNNVLSIICKSGYKGFKSDFKCRCLTEEREDIVVLSSSTLCEKCPLVIASEKDNVISVKVKHNEHLYGYLDVVYDSEITDEKKEFLLSVADDLAPFLFILWHKSDTELKNNILDTIPQLFSIVSTEYKYLYINSIYSELLGAPLENILGHSVSEFYPEKKFNNEIKPRFDNCFEGISQDYEVQVSYEKYGRVWIRAYYFPYYDNEGEIIGAIVHAVDITERKKIEKEFNFNEAKYRIFMETTPDSIIIVSDDLQITYVNELACRMLGWTKDELIGCPLSKIDKTCRAEGFKSGKDIIELNENRIVDSVYIKKNGHEISVEINVKKFIANGNIFLIGIARDITDRKRIELELMAAVKQARAADEMKSVFMANMSHEIRTPLNGILGFSSLMSDPDITPEKQKEYYNLIEKSGQRLLNTINDLINISKIETGEVEAIISDTDLNNLFDNLYDFFKPEFSLSSIDFKIIKNTSGGSSRIKTDVDKLEAVLINLIKNAVKFTHHGEVSFGYHFLKNKVEIFVKDTGVGIAADKLDYIFNRFAQAEQGLSKTYEGFGLGLSISKEYVNMLGGTLKVESEKNKGSRFFFTLPQG
ncbi:MAG: PAS domain-containing sensor histidine kinase [Spirochaetales bacterium]|nr:PAS domain-containing sensor histidine kinase [Spirochaetales bacterium]